MICGQAEEVAEEWYLKLRGMVRSGDLEKVTARKKEKTFQAAAEKFLDPKAQEQQMALVGRAVARPHPLHEQYRPAAG
ncbi:hypothetical protein LRP30_31130 [Bradyrhizobium sp. C-145]|uniref:hypothetical protein n=1 Tax=Bradyrhizobium sp. C-145 TaxID=574727 RepID=UPI00201B95CD|nr:hypothetical protein [Bradyrhizobium sp. C-145]UQR61364.1 hypothetical protein LRP30_31130 [Bradyrhizobium sp. C-145]